MSGRPSLALGTRVGAYTALAAVGPFVLFAGVVMWGVPSPAVAWALGAVALAWVIVVALLNVHNVSRPLQTLANLLGGLRRGDYSMRAAKARPDDPMGVVLQETNALADTLKEQRLGALEATALLRTVMGEIDVAVFAFDEDGTLRLINRAGERVLGLPRERARGQKADALGLEELRSGEHPRVVEFDLGGLRGRGEVRRSAFRQHGRPHDLLVVTDLSRALRQEELTAWRRLVRVLSHEINNSLTPIASAAGSLQRLTRSAQRADDWEEDLESGLSLIEGRARALGRFMRAYAQLARLPAPTPVAFELRPLVQRVAALEQRMKVRIEDSPEVQMTADPDQLEQVLINLVRNAVDATLTTGDADDGTVVVRWDTGQSQLELDVVDDGPGISDTKNLFVPFFSTKNGGQGIGLALGRQVAEAHGGTLSLENRDEGGARARLRLPLHA